MKPANRWVVMSEGYYLKSLDLAVRGAGLAGGAYTNDLRLAKKFSTRKAARATARFIPQGVVEKLSVVEKL